jgi:hypothetical protein
MTVSRYRVLVNRRLSFVLTASTIAEALAIVTREFPRAAIEVSDHAADTDTTR